MKLLLSVALLVCAASTWAEERTIAVGMPEIEAKTTLKMLGKDVTAGMEMTDSAPKEGMVWAFERYKTVLTVLYANGKVSHIIHNTLKDFSTSKSVRAEKEKEITSATFDTAHETCAVR